MVENSYGLAKYFDEVAEGIKTHGKSMSSDDMATIYGLFKQAKFGDNTTPQPSFYQFTEKGKWEAWNKHKGKSTDQAKHEYVELALSYYPDDQKSNYA